MRFSRNYADGPKRRLRRHRLVAALAAVGVLGAACSSTATSGTTGNAPSGSPINIGELVSLSGNNTHPGAVDGVNAAIAAVNKAGGVNGHPLKLVVCDDQDNPNVAAECANRLVSKHVIYVDNGSTQENAYMPVFRSAGIPVMSATGVQADVLTFANSYVLGSGLTSTGGAGAMCAKLGSTKIGVAQADVAGARQLVSTINTTIAPFGLDKSNVNVTLIPPTAVDFSAYAAALIQNSTCIVMFLPPKQTVPFTAAVHSQDPSVPVVALGAETASDWRTIGKLADNVCESAAFPPAELTEAPGVAQYNAEMAIYNKSGVRDIHSIAGWSGVHLAAKVLANVPDPTAAAYMQALNTAGTIDLPPIPPLNFAKPTNLIPGITRYMTLDVVYYHYANSGKAEPYFEGRYVDVMSLKSQPPIPTTPRC